MREYIPVASPALVGREREYVLDCLDSTWISSSGQYIERFEQAFADFCGVRYALACTNGTVALHLALLALGIGQGDEVVVPALTYVATANAVTYCGATPVLADSELATWNMDPAALEACITPRTRAIVVVHLYGHPVDMDPVLALARERGLFVIEDAAEAHGALYKGKKVGSLGDIATFSFYGNKIITTGEGGMVCTDDEGLARRVRQLKGQGYDPERRYWFPIVGYNYRMTNIEAAIGLAQLEKIDWHIARRREVASCYRRHLQSVDKVIFSPKAEWAESVYWMSSVLLESSGISRDRVMQKMLDCGVETRPFFHPIHTLPPYQGLRATCPVAEYLAGRGVNLPSSALLTEAQVQRVVEVLAWALNQE